ncbi:MAG: 6-bladed beta-propeller [Gemmatimonadota bacterium]
MHFALWSSRDHRKSTPWSILVLAALGSVVACTEESRGVSPANAELQEVVSVGLLDGPEEFLFGEIADVRAMSDGSFVVLDTQTPAVRWFGFDGEYRGAVSGVGQGPGELGAPMAIEVTDDDRMGVLDYSNARISVYRGTPEGLEHDGSIRVGALSPYAVNRRSLCAADGDWFVQHMEGDASVLRYDSSGELAGEFRAPIPLPEGGFDRYASIMEPSLNSAILHCARDVGLVVTAGFRSDTVRAFEPSGSELWHRALSGITPEQYQLEPVFGYASESAGAHVGVSAVRWSEGSLLVQYRYWSGARGQPDSTRIDSIELSLESGEELSRTTALPALLDVRGDLVYTAESEPFPRVRVWERGG